MNLQAIDKFHKTRLGYTVFGLVELALAFAAANWAIDNGSLWLWILTVIFLFGGLQNLGRLLTLTISKWRKTMR
jgi:hypothetical protein